MIVCYKIQIWLSIVVKTFMNKYWLTLEMVNVWIIHKISKNYNNNNPNIVKTYFEII